MSIQLQITGNAVSVETVPKGADEWNDNGVIAIGLKSIKATKFLSRDGGKDDLEGFITFGFNGQDTAIEWKAKVKAPGMVAADPALLYFGRANVLDEDGNPIPNRRRALELGCEMIESDKDAKERIEQWQKGLEAAGGFASLVPGYGAPIAAGLGLARSVLNIFKNRQDDDTELAVRKTLFPTGSGIEIERKSPKLTLELDVHHLTPGPDRKGALAVESVVFDLERGDFGGDHSVLFFDMICGAGEQRRTYSIQHTLEQADSAPKDGTKTQKIIDQFQSTRELSGAELFRGEMKYGVPVRFSARILRNQDTLNAIGALAAESGTFAANFLPERAASVVTTVSKAEASFRSFVLPLVTGKDEYSLGIFDGYLFPEFAAECPYLKPLPGPNQSVTLVSKGEHGTVQLKLKAID